MSNHEIDRFRVSGKLVGVKLRPHDRHRHAAAVASRYGLPIEIVSKVPLDQGKTTKEIAELKPVAKSTIDFHRLNIHCRLKFTNRKPNLQS